MSSMSKSFNKRRFVCLQLDSPSAVRVGVVKPALPLRGMSRSLCL